MQPLPISFQNSKPAESSPLNECVEFVLANRKDSNAFKDWPREEIEKTVAMGAFNGTFFVCRSPYTKQVIAVGHLVADEKAKRFMVANYIATNPLAHRQVISYLNEKYPDYGLDMKRNGRPVYYNAERKHRYFKTVWNNSFKTFQSV